MWSLLYCDSYFVSDGDSASLLYHRAGDSRRQPYTWISGSEKFKGLGRNPEEPEAAQSWSLMGTPDVRCSSLEEKVLQRRFLQRGYIL